LSRANRNRWLIHRTTNLLVWTLDKRI